MRVEKTDIESILNADLVPDEVYTFKMGKPKDQPAPEGTDPENHLPEWCNVQCQILEADDEELNTDEIIGRRITFWLISAGRSGRRGLNALIKHKVRYAPEEGWDQGIPVDESGEQDTANLEGVTFKGKVRRYQKKNGEWEQEIRPLMY
jgi:hypothetical protein